MDVALELGQGLCKNLTSYHLSVMSILFVPFQTYPR
jgi:hypothetical protein